MSQLLGLRLADLVNPINPDGPVREHEFLDIPAVTNQEDLIAVHRELLDTDNWPGTRMAATLVYSLSCSARRARTERARDMVTVVFRRIIADLRAPIGTPTAESRRFAKTIGELNHLDMINQADRDDAASANPTAR